MNFELARFNMVAQQLRPWNLHDEEVLERFTVVRREDFVPEGWRSLAFADIEIPLPGGASMLAPKIEAHLLQALQARRHGRALLVGAGSGHLAALLAMHAERVLAIEIVPELVELARDNLARAGIRNVSVELGDGSQGWPAQAPYDSILIAGALPKLPKALPGQLKVGGRLAGFVGRAPVMTLTTIHRRDEQAIERRGLLETCVPELVHEPVDDGFVF